MKINVTEVGLELQDLSTSELRVIADGLSVLISEAGTGQAYASEVAERLAQEIPKIIYNVPRYFCNQCRTNFYEDESVVLEIGSRAEKIEVCPRCECHLIERLPFTPGGYKSA